MDATRPISSVISLPPKREDNGAFPFGRKNTATEQDLAPKYRQSDAGNAIAKRPAGVPVQLQEIRQTFVSTRETEGRTHTPYSAQFLAQQLSQQEDAVSFSDPALAHRRAISAYDNSLGLTATVIGFAGRAERIA